MDAGRSLYAASSVYTDRLVSGGREMTMQDFDARVEDADSSEERSARLEHARLIMRHLTKKVLVFVCFGPGFLGVLWLISRLLKR